jgi:hypothetical protein
MKVPWILEICINNGTYQCNLGYACDGCPYNIDYMAFKCKDCNVIFLVPDRELSKNYLFEEITGEMATSCIKCRGDAYPLIKEVYENGI